MHKPFVALLASVVFAWSSEGFGTNLYTVDDGTSAVKVGNADGSGGLTTLLTGGGGADRIGLAVDTLNGRIFWVETVEIDISVFIGSIHAGNLDGSGTPVTVYDDSDGVGTPSGLAVDGGNGRLYWTDSTNDTINVGTVNGSTAPTVLFNPSDGLQRPVGLAIDLGAARLYWSDNLANRIQSGSTSGAGTPVTLFNSLDGLVDPYGLALDTAGGKIYWADFGSVRVLSGNLDGSGSPTTLYDTTDGLVQPLGVALDIAQSTIYWSDSNLSPRLQSGNFSGSGSPVTLFDQTDGLSDPSGLALVFPADSDQDLLIDDVETDTGIFVNATDTGSDPGNPDSDGDGVLDGIEVSLGTDPNNALDFPQLALTGWLGLALFLACAGAVALITKRARIAN